MNEIKERIEKELASKIKVKNEKKNEQKEGRKFSWPAFFAGDEYNQELAKNSEIKENNIIDFAKENKQEREFIENKIKDIVNSSTNKQLIEQGKFPIIWFKDIDKTENNSPLQKFLLALLDPAQNATLSVKGEIVDLSQFVLIVTSSTYDTSKLPNPVFSRLDCINVDTAKPKEFFWNKYFYHVLIASLLTCVVLVLMIVYYSDRKDTKTKN